MKLYYYETPNPRKACAVAKYLNSQVEYIKVDLSKGEQRRADYLAINPNGKLPTLVDGDVTLWEAHAIMAYLALKAGSDIWPSDPIRQIEVIKWLNWDTSHFSRQAGRMWFENFLKGKLVPGEPDREEVEQAAKFFIQFARVLDDHLQGKDYIVGDSITIADFGVATFLPIADQAQLPLEGFDEIKRWHDTTMNFEAWRQPWPEG